jgi:predicted O-methyltransferase YrrM
MSSIAKRITGRISNLLKERKFLNQYSQSLGQSFEIKSHLTISERVQLYTLAQNKRIILEIGSYVGASACCFGAAMKIANQGTVFCIDTWKNDAMSEGNWDTLAQFSSNTAAFSEFIIPVQGFSTNVVGDISAKVTHLDLLFIDGDHSYDGAKADWEAYKHLLHPGSIVVFHDWGWAEGVQRVVEEDAKPVVESFATLPNLWWGTIKG